MTRVKICGLRDADSALVAAEAGADFLGFVFVPGARRRLAVDEAQGIIASLKKRLGGSLPPTVGLFMDQPAEEVNAVAKTCGLDRVQLCGKEPPDYWRRMEKPILKVVKVPQGPVSEGRLKALRSQAAAVEKAEHILLLDTLVEGMSGGAGRSFDWALAKEIAPSGGFLLAGGLTPENVAQAIRTARPWGVDVSSGVETGGQKDADKIRAFVRNAKGL